MRRKLGDLHITCSQNFDERNVCVGIFRFAGKGQITVDAEPVFPNPVTGVVTGGSGAFFGAGGQADIVPQADGATLITFHLDS
ncbi:MAG TPA: hypothetical protein VGH10_13075 [Actinomycetota bacterium]|jgi:hypothetical protein